MTTDEMLDVVQFVRDGRRRQQNVLLSRLTRLQDVLASNNGALVVDLIGRSTGGKLFLGFSIVGQLELVCQRCLQPVAFPLVLRGELSVVEAVADLGVQSSDDEWSADDIDDVLIADRPLSMIELIEDEVVLALPMVVRHDDCRIVVNQGRSAESSPFAALRAIKVS